MSTPADPRDEARAWTHRALTQEWRYDGPDVRDHADVLMSAAEEADTPVEELIRWIHDPATVEYTLELWRDHLERYTSLRARLKLERFSFRRVEVLATRHAASRSEAGTKASGAPTHANPGT